MKMKKFLATVLAVSLTSLTFASCSPNKTTTNSNGGGIDLKGQTVTLYGMDDPNKPDISPKDKENREKQKELVQKKYNCKLEFVELNVEYDTIPTEISKLSAAGKPLADIIRVNGFFVPQLIKSDVLNDITPNTKELGIAKRFLQPATYQNKVYGFANSNVYATDGLIFNVDMIKKAGMSKLPNEMFKEGKWSYNDFYQYLTELKGKLPDKTYPFFIDPYVWSLLAPHANGSFVANSNGKLGYLNDGTIESLEILKKINDNNLVRPANTDKDGKLNYGATIQETFNKQSEIAMTCRAMWQVEFDLVGKFNFGFVPYPWGSQVQVNGDYKTLSDNYKVSYYNADVILTLKKDKPVAPAVDLLKIAADYRGDDVKKMQELYQQYEAKGLEVPLIPSNSERWFNDELSVSIFEWQNNRLAFEAYESLNTVAELGFKKAVKNEIYENKKAVRPALEAIYSNDVEKLKSIGF